MNWHKKLAIGVSLFLEPYEWNEIFKRYGEYIGEIYFAPAINDARFHQHSEIIKQMLNSEDMSRRTAEIANMAKVWDIKINLVINTTLDVDRSVVRTALGWCKVWNIVPDKITVVDPLAIEVFILSPIGCEIVSSFNNNLEYKDGKFNVEDIGFYDEVVIGGRNIRNKKIIEELHYADCKVELLLNNGCSHNCLYCSTRKSEFCEDIVDKNIEKNGLLYQMAEQSIYPSEIEKYYNKLGIDLYKLSTRQFSSVWDFIKTIKMYVEGIDPKTKDDFIYTCTLTGIVNHVIKHEFTDEDWDEILRIKDKIWSIQNSGE